MKNILLVMSACAVVAGCAQVPGGKAVGPQDAVAGDDAARRPLARPAGLGRVVPKAARTVEEFDVTTAAERAEAAKAPVAVAERKLGTTVASLGDPTEAGFWIKTPLVAKETAGRVVLPSNGKSVQVTLRPLDSAATAGSRMSLAAMRVIEAPLTGLPEVVVYTGG